VFLGWAFAGEQLSVRELLAAGIIILAVVLITFTQATAQARSTIVLPAPELAESA
jgi:drug/metabolite transporter (DMT)-like permease